MNHDADNHARLVRLVAPGMVDSLDNCGVTGLQERLVRVGHEIDLAICDNEHVAGVCAMHAGMALEILLGRRILLFHLPVQFLQGFDVLPCVLAVGRNFQGAEDQAVLRGFTGGDVPRCGLPVSGCSQEAP